MLELARARESDRKWSKVLKIAAVVVLRMESTCDGGEKIKRKHSTFARHS